MGVRTRRYHIAAYLRTNATDAEARDETRRVIERWNQHLTAGRDMWWSPTIRAAVMAGTPWLMVARLGANAEDHRVARIGAGANAGGPP